MDDDLSRQRYERGTDPSRVLAFSDGVFAIIITLLVLEIRVPELAGGQTLADALDEVRPSFVAFLISFVVVAIAWAGHRDLFALVRRTDRPLVWLNFVYLLPLSVLPFGALLISRYEDDPVALRMYGLILIAIAVTRLGTWVYATARPHLLFASVDARSRWAGVILVAVPAVGYALGTALAPASPTAALVIFAVVPILYFVVIALARTTAPPGSAEREFT
jgi:uncharacterized membrane protein